MSAPRRRRRLRCRPYPLPFSARYLEFRTNIVLPAGKLILEGLMTTLSADGSVNISPMGPIVDESMSELMLRPYQTSTTYRNLKRTRQGVFHVTDDVELIAHAALGQPDPLPPLAPVSSVTGQMITTACRWYALQVRTLDDSAERTEIICDVVDRGTLREFFGFNRAKHAVLEAAILATRVALLPAEDIRAEIARLKSPVQKTGGPAELRAFEYLGREIERRITDLAHGREPKSST